MAATLKRVPDASAVDERVWLFRYAFGGLAPLKFRAISYGGGAGIAKKTPTDNTGLTFQILIKNARTDLDSAAIVNDANQTAVFIFLSDPLIIGYPLDTEGIDTNGGFSKGTKYPGELWVQDVDPLYGRQLVTEFIVDLSSPIKETFDEP